MARVGRPRGGGGRKPKVGWRRAGVDARSTALGAPVQIVFDLSSDARKPVYMNRGKPGGRYLPGEMMAVAVCVARDLSRAGLRKIAGSLAEASGGACTVTHFQIWRGPWPWASATCRGTCAAAGRASSGWGTRGSGSCRTSAARRGAAARRGGQEVAMAVHGGVGVDLGPGRAAARGGMYVARTVGRMAQADVVVFDGTALAARATDEHRRTRNEWGSAGENTTGRPSPCRPQGSPGRAARSGPACTCWQTRHTRRARPCRGAPTTARAVIPARTSSPGKSRGSMEWRRHAADSLVPREMHRRSVRGGDIQSLPPGVRAEAQRRWMEKNAYGRRAAVGHVIGAPRAALDGAVSSRRPDLVALEMARKATVYNSACP